MKVKNVEKLENNKVKLTIEVDKQAFEEGVEKAYRKNVKYISIPGFRKGKAPRKVCEKYYGEGVFYEDAINFVCPDAYDKAVAKSGIKPVDRPEVDIEQLESGKAFVFTAVVAVKPEFEVAEYKGIKLDKIEYKVLAKDVNAEIDRRREQNARLVSIETAAKKGNIAVIDYEGFVDGVAFDGGKGENHNLELGSGQFIPGFEDQLIGKKAGQEVDVNVTFPTEYHAEELAGKEAVFKVKINEVKKKELPAADDEFAKDVSEFDTLDELKADIKAKMTEANNVRAKRETEDKIVDAIAEKTEIDIPECMIETQIDKMLQDFEYRISAQGITLEQYQQVTGIDEATMRGQFKDGAARSVKINLILEKIAEIEKIEVTKEEIEEELKRMSEQYSMELKKVKNIMKNSMDGLKADLSVNKTLTFLVDNAKITKKAKSKGEEKDESGADGNRAD